MRNCYLGIDIGSVSTKAVVIDPQKNILFSSYLLTEGAPLTAVRELMDALRRKMEGSGCRVCAVGTTGSARKLIGAITGAAVIKNEITAHAVGTLSMFPEARTVFEIGGQDSKVILLDGGVVRDYAMNTLCAAGTGAFLTAQAQRLGIAVEEFGAVAATASAPASIAARCTVFAESDLVHKLQMGYRKEEVVAGLCEAVAANYLNHVCRGKQIASPVVFQGGVSKNAGVVAALEKRLGERVLVDPNGHLAGALGVAILALRTGENRPFSFALLDMEVATRVSVCQGCSNRCERIMVYRGERLLDAWGNRCPKGKLI